MPGTDWVWQQVDENGNYVGSANGPFPTEGAAKDAALKTLKGDAWD
jgi:hypothetical protein